MKRVHSTVFCKLTLTMELFWISLAPLEPLKRFEGMTARMIPWTDKLSLTFSKCSHLPNTFLPSDFIKNSNVFTRPRNSSLMSFLVLSSQCYKSPTVTQNKTFQRTFSSGATEPNQATIMNLPTLARNRFTQNAMWKMNFYCAKSGQRFVLFQLMPCYKHFKTLRSTAWSTVCFWNTNL
jgi:hypothetical protein